MNAARPMVLWVPHVTLVRSMLATKSLQDPPGEIAQGSLRRRCCRGRGDGPNPSAYSDNIRRGQAADWNCLRRFGGVGREREEGTQCGPRIATLRRRGAEQDNPIPMGLS